MSINQPGQSAAAKLVTLIDCLVEHDLPIDVLQTAIQRFGVYQETPNGLTQAEEHGQVTLACFSFLEAYERAHDIFGEETEVWCPERLAVEAPQGCGWPLELLPDVAALDKLLRPVFVTVFDLLNNREPIAHAALALEIQSNGVWRKDGPHQFAHHAHNSLTAAEALTGIAINLVYRDNPPAPEDLETYLEIDPLFSLGWPEDNLPIFKSNDDQWIDTFNSLMDRGSLYRRDLMTVGRLILSGKATPGTIKTAVEMHGVYGFDSHGRLTKYSNTSPPVRELDKVLSHFARLILRGTTPKIEDMNGIENVIFGWPYTELPDFEAIAQLPALDHSQSTPSPIPKTDPWPWGKHSTKSLEALAEAGQKFWSTFNPNIPSTAPRNEDVIAWLIKSHGLGEKRAYYIASILRAENVPDGPRL
jgi:hypothetical protein